MRVEVKVKPGSKKEEVAAAGEGSFKVFVKERAVEGKANEAVIKALAAHFKVPKSCVQLIGGLKSKVKRFEIII